MIIITSLKVSTNAYGEDDFLKKFNLPGNIVFKVNEEQDTSRDLCAQEKNKDFINKIFFDFTEKLKRYVQKDVLPIPTKIKTAFSLSIRCQDFDVTKNIPAFFSLDFNSLKLSITFDSKKFNSPSDLKDEIQHELMHLLSYLYLLPHLQSSSKVNSENKISTMNFPRWANEGLAQALEEIFWQGKKAPLLIRIKSRPKLLKNQLKTLTKRSDIKEYVLNLYGQSLLFIHFLDFEYFDGRFLYTYFNEIPRFFESASHFHFGDYLTFLLQQKDKNKNFESTLNHFEETKQSFDLQYL